VSSEPKAFVTIDHGSATLAVALIGRVDGRWRLLGATAGPASVVREALIERLRRRLAAADPDLAAALGLTEPAAGGALPQVACSTSPPPEIVVVAATSRALAPLASAAELSGWRVQRVVLEAAPIASVAASLANPMSTAILTGAGDPPGADERPLMGELAAQVAAAADRRPDVALVLTGSLATPGGRHEVAIRPDRPGAVVMAPRPDAAAGMPLRHLLDGLRAADDDGRRALVAATATLAEVLQRSVELVEVGQSCGMRVVARHVPGSAAVVEAAIVAEAALLPRGFTDGNLDTIAGWLTMPIDRLRLRDRLRDLALVPWGDAAGDGLDLRLAAVRAAVGRLAAATHHLDASPPPGTVVAAGGVFAAGPAQATALAVADAVRRPGIRALAVDHARLLAPLGTIVDPDERRHVMSDLRDELVVPLGTVVMPAGLRAGRPAGHLHLQASSTETELELVPGGIGRIDLAPGATAIADLRLRDAADLGVRVRRLVAETTGGLAGVLVDLRDVPMRLPDRPERRREVLAAWRRDVMTGVDR
jgi:hypothetical protein